MDLSEALSQCELEFSSTEVVIHCPSAEIAGEIWEHQQLISANLADFKGVRWVHIAMGGKELLPAFPINNDANLIMTTKLLSPLTLSKDAGFASVLDFVCNSTAPVCVTNHLTHTCLLLNNLYTPERIIWQPSQYMGLNFLYYWRDSMDDFEHLLRELRQNGKLENFRYKMRRVDNSLAYYVMDYQLIEDFLGSPARISVSHEWGVVEPAPISN